MTKFLQCWRRVFGRRLITPGKNLSFVMLVTVFSLLITSAMWNARFRPPEHITWPKLPATLVEKLHFVRLRAVLRCIRAIRFPKPVRCGVSLFYKTYDAADISEGELRLNAEAIKVHSVLKSSARIAKSEERHNKSE